MSSEEQQKLLLSLLTSQLMQGGPASLKSFGLGGPIPLSSDAPLPEGIMGGLTASAAASDEQTAWENAASAGEQAIRDGGPLNSAWGGFMSGYATMENILNARDNKNLLRRYGEFLAKQQTEGGANAEGYQKTPSGNPSENQVGGGERPTGGPSSSLPSGNNTPGQFGGASPNDAQIGYTTGPAASAGDSVGIGGPGNGKGGGMSIGGIAGGALGSIGGSIGGGGGGLGGGGGGGIGGGLGGGGGAALGAGPGIEAAEQATGAGPTATPGGSMLQGMLDSGLGPAADPGGLGKHVGNYLDGKPAGYNMGNLPGQVNEYITPQFSSTADIGKPSDDSMTVPSGTEAKQSPAVDFEYGGSRAPTGEWMQTRAPGQWNAMYGSDFGLTFPSLNVRTQVAPTNPSMYRGFLPRR